MKIISLFFISVFFISTCGTAAAVDRQKLTKNIQLGRYKFTEHFYQEDPSEIKLQSFTVSLNGKVVLRRSLKQSDQDDGNLFGFIDAQRSQTRNQIYEDGYNISPYPIAKDINGDGLPEIILVRSLGGNSNNYQYSIFTLASQGPRKIFEISDHIGPIVFVRSDQASKKAQYVIKVGDNNDGYLYWECLTTANVYRPNPEVTLRWNGQSFVPSLQDMRKPPLSSAALASLAAKLNSQILSQNDPVYLKHEGNKQAVFPAVVENMLELVYSGNAPSAKKLLELIYPGKIQLQTINHQSGEVEWQPTKEEFWKQFLDTIRESEYMPLLKKLNAGVF